MGQSAARKHDSTRRATYQDVLDAPANCVAEIMEMGMDPVHPGECIRESVEAMGWTVGEAARRLGVSRAAFSRVLNARAAMRRRVVDREPVRP